MNNSVIELKQVSKFFDGDSVLSEIDLSIRYGEFFTLLGPSGCGKTTLLRLISGFETPSVGQIYIQGKNVTQTPAQERDVRTVFQSYALFPHMTVFDNVAFGLRCKKIPEREINIEVREILESVKLSGLADRKPDQLSGGQQQRVAIARALVNKPLVLLLDEPLSALDYRLRKAMQIELKQLQRKLGITFIFVTHDQKEALSMSDRVAVLDAGKIQQIGTPREIYETPKKLSVAKFIGELNIFNAQVSQTTDKQLITTIEGMQFTLNNKGNFAAKDRIHVLVRPEDVRVWDRTEVTNTTDMFPGTVEAVIYKGSTVDLMVRLASGYLIAASEFFDEEDEDLAYVIGESVWVEWVHGWEVILPYEDK